MSENPNDDLRADLTLAVNASDQGGWEKALNKETESEAVAETPLRQPSGEAAARPDGGAGDPTSETARASPPPSAPEEQAPEKTAPAPERVGPPAHWKGGGKIDWNRLPKNVQSEIASDYQKIGELERQYAGIARVIEPRMDNIIAEFGSPGAFVERMLQLSDFASRDPVSFIQWYAKNRGVDLAALLPAAPAPAQPLSSDPATSALQQRLAQLEQHTLQQHRSAQQNALARDEQIVAQFFSNPKNVYAQDLRLTMADLLTSKQAATLEEAYEKAMWLHPQTREALLQQRAESEKQARQQQLKKAVNAAGSVTGNPVNGLASANGRDDVRSSIIASISEVEGRA